MTSLYVDSIRRALSSASTEPDVEPSFAVLGGPGARLLAGPVGADGPESLFDHERRLGALHLGSTSAEELRKMIAASGLLGRGGGQFPIARKLQLAAASSGDALVVVNASEGEPASRKDRTLLEMRPHLLLDGALVAATAAQASEIVIYLHRERRSSTAAVEAAIAERAGLDVSIRVVDAPVGYVAGESSAVVSYLEGGQALPRRSRVPAASSGVFSRPTVVSNVETVAHLALIARFGAGWFAESGGRDSPGSTLVTIAGEVSSPGVVAEVFGPATVGDLLAELGGLDRQPRAVLVGGYEGAWLDASVAWNAPIDRGALMGSGLSLGCGLLCVLDRDSCGIATTARLVRWLAHESAGQCGPCQFGLPAVADALELLAEGRALRRDLRRLHELCAAIEGRGACGHPSGVVALVESALDTFAPELRGHLRGQACVPSYHGFPIPVHNERKGR